MTFPSPSSLVLVAVMKDPRDLEIARLLGWYRIPLRSAPKVVAVDYLAFYQTAAFGEGRWRIQYLAPVRGHELVTRKELLRDEADHPHANHEYYKIELGPLLALPQPIMAEAWRRVTFFYTTGEYLMRARSLHELILASEERPLLWKALRERTLPAQAEKEGSGHQSEINPLILAELLGIHDFISIKPGNDPENWNPGVT